MNSGCSLYVQLSLICVSGYGRDEKKGPGNLSGPFFCLLRN